MARFNYEQSLQRLLKHEGGYTNHPSDPGGPTNYGITIHDYRKYINPRGTAADVKNMAVSEAKKIYREKYWDLMRCDELPPGVDYIVFDYGVHSGVGRAGKVLRRLVGMKDTTWKISDDVIAAVKRRSPETLVDALCSERLRYLRCLKNWKVFGRGWNRRVIESRAAGMAMAKGQSTWVEQTPDLEGSAQVQEVNPIAKTGSAVLAAGTAGVVAVYSWAIENPILAALIIQAMIGFAIMILHQRDEKDKPLPVPEAFDPGVEETPPHEVLPGPEPDEDSVPVPEPDPVLGEPLVSPPMQTLLSSEAKPLKKLGD